MTHADVSDGEDLPIWIVVWIYRKVASDGWEGAVLQHGGWARRLKTFRRKKQQQVMKCCYAGAVMRADPVGLPERRKINKKSGDRNASSFSRSGFWKLYKGDKQNLS
jgi:hypothetical protein